MLFWVLFQTQKLCKILLQNASQNVPSPAILSIRCISFLFEQAEIPKKLSTSFSGSFPPLHTSGGKDPGWGWSCATQNLGGRIYNVIGEGMYVYPICRLGVPNEY